MSSYDAPTGRAEDRATGSSPAPAPQPAVPELQTDGPARVGTIVWGLIVVALAALLVVSQLGIVVLNGTYVLIGLMIGAGANRQRTAKALRAFIDSAVLPALVDRFLRDHAAESTEAPQANPSA